MNMKEEGWAILKHDLAFQSLSGILNQKEESSFESHFEWKALCYLVVPRSTERKQEG